MNQYPCKEERAKYTKQVLVLADAQAALKAICEKVAKQIEKEPGLTAVAAVVADEHGDIIALARMDGVVAQTTSMAIKKARTAALIRRDTRGVRAILQEEGLHPSELGDITRLTGGIIITKPGEPRVRKYGRKGPTILGAIGVGGRTGEDDEVLAFVGLRALQKALGKSS